jgi:hypothetical protein
MSFDQIASSVGVRNRRHIVEESRGEKPAVRFVVGHRRAEFDVDWGQGKQR